MLPMTHSHSASAAEHLQQPSTTLLPQPDVSCISEREENDLTPPGFCFSHSEGQYHTPMDGRDPPPHFPLFPTNTPTNPFCHCTPEVEFLVGGQQSLESLCVEIKAHQHKMADLTAEATALNACLTLLPSTSDDHQGSAHTPWNSEMAVPSPHTQ